MTPEEMENRILELERTVEDMQNPNTISPAFAKVIEQSGLTVSAKAVSSEDQAVDEAGSATYNVLTEPVGWLQVTVGGATYYIPRYNA